MTNCVKVIPLSLTTSFSRLLLVCCISLLSIQMGLAHQVTDSFGKHKFDKVPERIVVTDWALLEQMLVLGITPVGAPELELYRQYVSQPALPEGIVDIGLRRSPNLKVIKQLAPEVIILGTDQKSLARPFSRISRVMYYKSFSDKYRTNGKKSRERFLQISDLFKKRTLAEQLLAAMDRELIQIKQEINQHFNGNVPKLSIVRFSSAEKGLLYGANSIIDHTLQLLGIEQALSSSRSKWGEKELLIADLQEVNQGLLLYVNPVIYPEIFSSSAWLSLAIVKSGRTFELDPVWSYGGAMSVLYGARAIRKTLLAIGASS